MAPHPKAATSPHAHWKRLTPWEPRKKAPKKVLSNGDSVTVLPDSGATVSAMDEATFRRYGLKGKVKVKKSRCQKSRMALPMRRTSYPYWAALKHSLSRKTKMKVVTWQLIKGDTQTAPLLSYEDGKDLGMIHVSNAI